MKNRTYDFLKYVGQYALPATALLVIAVGEIWGASYYKEVAGTITALGIFLNALLQEKATAFWRTREIVEKNENEAD